MDEEILKWFADYCIGKLDKEGEAGLRAWVKKTPENREIFEKYLQLIKLHRMVEGEQRISDEKSWKNLCQKLIKRKHRRLYRRVIAVAASVLICAGVGWEMLQEKPEREVLFPMTGILPGSTKATLVLANGSSIDLTRNDLKEVKEQGALIKNDTAIGLQYDHSDLQIERPVLHTIKVPVAGEYHFTLSDGTKVWINSDSELTFPVTFQESRREVFVKGEAYFEVEPDRLRPFIVHARDVAIQVLGTRFNVSAYEESRQVTTTLAQGRVAVELNGQTTLLHPGDQAVADVQHQTIMKRQVETGMYISWIKGIFEYENMSLADIAVQLSRWYDVEFRFSAPEFKERRFTGVVKKYDMLNDVLRIIEKTTNVCFMINGREIAVKSAGL